MTIRTFPAALVAVLALAATTQRAEAQRADEYVLTPIPEHWQGRATAPVEDQLPEVAIDGDRWWSMFNDPALDALMARVEAQNYDARVAARRIQMAQLQLDAVRGQYYPQVNLGAGWTASRSSGLTMGSHGSAVNSQMWDASVSASWEIDVFGRVSAQAKEKKYGVYISRADYAGTMLSLQAQLVTAYIDLRMAQCQKRLAQEHAASQDTVLKMTEARFKAGLASLLDVTQARSVYYQTISQVPLLDSQIGADLNAIATLCGTYAEDLAVNLEAEGDARMPDFHFLVANEMPSALLERRPDVYAARMTIEKDAAAAGLAKKAYLPVLRLNGSFGTTVHALKDFGNHSGLTYSVAPSISWTAFDGLQRKYNVALAKEQMQADIDAYNQTLIGAVSDVNNAMRRYKAILRYIHSLDEVIRQSEKALALSTELFKLKLAAFINVADAQMTLLSSQNTLITAQAQAATAVVTLCKALGGGFTANE